MDIRELAQHHGLTLEEHVVETTEGERIMMFRLPNPGKPPLMIQHCFTGTPRHYFVFGQESYAAKVHSYGFDVWLPSTRDTTYSRPKDQSFIWNHTWENMALEDLPQTIDYVLKATGFSKLNYIGHSMGTIMIYALLSEKVEYNVKINLAISLAPAVFLNTGINSGHQSLPLGFFESITEGAIRYPTAWSSTICIISDTLYHLALNEMFIYDQAQFTYEDYLIFVGDLPNTLSITNSHRMNAMWGATDYVFWNTMVTPARPFDLKNVSADQVIFGGDIDRIAPRTDTDELIKQIDPTKLKLQKWYPNRDHFNFWVTTNDEHQKDLEKILSQYKDFK